MTNSNTTKGYILIMRIWLSTTIKVSIPNNSTKYRYLQYLYTKEINSPFKILVCPNTKVKAAERRWSLAGKKEPSTITLDFLLNWKKIEFS